MSVVFVDLREFGVARELAVGPIDVIFVLVVVGSRVVDVVVTIQIAQGRSRKLTNRRRLDTISHPRARCRRLVHARDQALVHTQRDVRALVVDFDGLPVHDAGAVRLGRNGIATGVEMHEGLL